MIPRRTTCPGRFPFHTKSSWFSNIFTDWVYVTLLLAVSFQIPNLSVCRISSKMYVTVWSFLVLKRLGFEIWNVKGCRFRYMICITVACRFMSHVVLSFQQLWFVSSRWVSTITNTLSGWILTKNISLTCVLLRSRNYCGLQFARRGAPTNQSPFKHRSQTSIKVRN